MNSVTRLISGDNTVEERVKMIRDTLISRGIIFIAMYRIMTSILSMFRNQLLCMLF